MSSVASFTITNAAVVLPDEVLERATVRIEDGIIAAIEAGPLSSATEEAVTVDAGGAYLMPGVVDLHNDNLEFEINPRPNANIPLPLALATMERRLASCGVTTEFHAVAFMEWPKGKRTVADAEATAAYLARVERDPSRAVRHRALHRLEIRATGALDAAFASLSQFEIRYVSINDHSPGQGQYRDVERLIQMAHEDADRKGTPRTDAEWYRQRMREAEADTETVPAFYERVRREAQRQPLVISTHDDDTIAKVDAQLAIGATVAEFPITMEAAQHARDHGMTIVVGAPNILRGGSQSGNLAAVELIRAGLADAICADYHAPSLIPAAFKLVGEGLVDLPAAIRMITANPAKAVGLDRTGEIAPGYLADLALVRVDDDGLPQVEATWTGGRLGIAFPGHNQDLAELIRDNRQRREAVR